MIAPIVPDQTTGGSGGLGNQIAFVPPTENVGGENTGNTGGNALQPAESQANVAEEEENAGGTNPPAGEIPEQNLTSEQGANVESATGGVPQESLGAAIFNVLTLGTGNNWIGGIIIALIGLLLLYLIYSWFKKKEN